MQCTIRSTEVASVDVDRLAKALLRLDKVDPSITTRLTPEAKARLVAHLYSIDIFEPSDGRVASLVTLEVKQRRGQERPWWRLWGQK